MVFSGYMEEDRALCFFGWRRTLILPPFSHNQKGQTTDIQSDLVALDLVSAPGAFLAALFRRSGLNKSEVFRLNIKMAGRNQPRHFSINH